MFPIEELNRNNDHKKSHTHLTFTSKGFGHSFYFSVGFELILMYLLAKQSFSSVNVSFQSAVTTFNDFNKPECVFIMSVVIFIQSMFNKSYFIRNI